MGIIFPFLFDYNLAIYYSDRRLPNPPKAPTAAGIRKLQIPPPLPHYVGGEASYITI